jgi:hypothetical protein
LSSVILGFFATTCLGLGLARGEAATDFDGLMGSDFCIISEHRICINM